MKEMKDKNTFPDLYVISPFKNVSLEASRLLLNNKSKWLPKDTELSDEKVTSWVNSNVGTIHSFQGKEASGVIMILGGNIKKPGAITWVCEEPNILNVAATRAKENFYIIGNPKVWNKGVFRIIRRTIKIEK
jgi:superfamily I DNA and/or RNA helicase